MAENDKKAFFFIHAINAAFNFNMEFFSFFFGITVFLDKNFGLICFVNIFPGNFFNDINKVFMDFGQNTIFVYGLGRP